MAELIETKKPDPEGLLHLIHEAGADPAETLMVGDSTVDIQTARNAPPELRSDIRSNRDARSCTRFLNREPPALLPIVLGAQAAK